MGWLNGVGSCGRKDSFGGRGAGIRCHCPHVMMLPAWASDIEHGAVQVGRPLRLCCVVVEQFVARDCMGCGAFLFPLVVRTGLTRAVML